MLRDKLSSKSEFQALSGSKLVFDVRMKSLVGGGGGENISVSQLMLVTRQKTQVSLRRFNLSSEEASGLAEGFL